MIFRYEIGRKESLVVAKFGIHDHTAATVATPRQQKENAVVVRCERSQKFKLNTICEQHFEIRKNDEVEIVFVFFSSEFSAKEFLECTAHVRGGRLRSAGFVFSKRPEFLVGDCGKNTPINGYGFGESASVRHFCMSKLSGESFQRGIRTYDAVKVPSHLDFEFGLKTLYDIRRFHYFADTSMIRPTASGSVYFVVNWRKLSISEIFGSSLMLRNS